MNRKPTAEFAAGYDAYVRARRWHSPEILFGLCQEYLRPGQKLLDLGIGTGLSGHPFKQAGLRIHGIDHSEEMLEVCRTKALADELHVLDISSSRFPYVNGTFDLVIAAGVFHLIGDLAHIFEEAARVLATTGFFAFTFDAHTPEKKGGPERAGVRGVWRVEDPESGSAGYRHTEAYIERKLRDNRLKDLKKTSFIGFKEARRGSIFVFRAWVTKKASFPESAAE
jgi:predicted TPR repeat methyltransferase